jgi:hypothetical protein
MVMTNCIIVKPLWLLIGFVGVIAPPMSKHLGFARGQFSKACANSIPVEFQWLLAGDPGAVLPKVTINGSALHTGLQRFSGIGEALRLYKENVIKKSSVAVAVPHAAGAIGRCSAPLSSDRGA